MATGWQKPAYGRTIDQAAIDTGLRQYMLGIYNMMAGGLAVTGIVAFLVSSSPELMATLFNTPLKFVVMLAPFGFVLFFSVRIQQMSAATAQLVFWLFAGTMGLSLSTIFLVYTHSSIGQVFFITAGMFGGMSLYGYSTRKDLSGMGSFLIMGLWGIILASIVNIFVASSAVSFAISVLGVLIFTGLTAYDTQRLKELYADSYDRESISKIQTWGALTLYLDFINLFMMLLRLMGDRR